MMIEKLKQQIKDSVREFGEIRITRGAFGDNASSIGVVEYVNPTEEGTFTKYFGNAYLYKGYPDLDITEQLQLGKGFLSRIPREMFWEQLDMRIHLILKAIFNRRGFYDFVWRYSLVVSEQLKKLNESNPVLRGYRFSPFIKELKRALYASLEKNGYNIKKDVKRGNLGGIIANLAEFFFLFVEMDTAYRLPLRDLFEEIDKSNPPRREVKRLMEVFVERSRNFNAFLIRKFIRAFEIVLVLMRLRSVRKIVEGFIEELNYDILKRDDDDWYYCLDRKYDHRGLSLDDRLLIKKAMDEEAGNIDLWQCYLEEAKKGETKDFESWLIND